MVNPELVEEIERSMYVDDLISGGETTKQALEIKMTATTIFGEATFKLHKRHSNNRELEVETATSDEESQSNAKQQLGTRKGESKLLGVPWDKEKDEIKVSFPISTAEPTKGASLENSQKSTIHSVWLHPWPSLWLTIPRLEQMAGRVAANLVQNVKEVLKGFPVRSVYGLWHSSIGMEPWKWRHKQFVGNRVRKIQEKQINWRHVPTEENPADVGSRGGDVSRLTGLWWQGPSWLAKPQDRPPDLLTTST